MFIVSIESNQLCKLNLVYQFKTSRSAKSLQMWSCKNGIDVKLILWKGSRRVWLSRTGIVMLLRSDIDGSLGGSSHSPGVIDVKCNFLSPKPVCTWWRTISYARWPCYAEHSGSKEVNLEKTIPNPTVWVPCLWDEWQWVSLIQTAPSGIPGDLPEVIQPYQVWGLYLVDLIILPLFVGP